MLSTVLQSSLAAFFTPNVLDRFESSIACNGPNQGAIPAIIGVIAPTARPQKQVWEKN